MDAWPDEADLPAPRDGGPIDALLREAACEFDAPIALLSRDDERLPNPELPAQAYAPITGSDGERLGTLCVLGLTNRTVTSPAKIARLHEIAARAALALQAPSPSS